MQIQRASYNQLSKFSAISSAPFEWLALLKENLNRHASILMVTEVVLTHLNKMQSEAGSSKHFDLP